MITDLSISPGNIELGDIPSISLRPVLDCKNCKFCSPRCYAKKAWRMYPATRAAWSRNSEMAHNNSAEYFRQAGSWIYWRRPRFFRWHIAGDILDQNYYAGMCKIARDNPDTKFLAFTKRWDLNLRAPSNLAARLSMWPGQPVGRKRLPRAWVQDGTETRIPADALECPGNCETCGACWGLSGDVWFREHYARAKHNRKAK